MKIIILSGSNRMSATSTRLAAIVGQLISQKGHIVHLFDLFQTPLPFYSPDGVEQDHVSVQQLRQAMLQAGSCLHRPSTMAAFRACSKMRWTTWGRIIFAEKPYCP